ncbi:hypothetical protein QQ045_018848 [Rhodiola kirilowii]
MAQVHYSVFNTSLIHIWNPATGKHKNLLWPPLFDNEFHNYKFGFMGFGYEANINDYKVVVLLPFHAGDGEWRAQVMSLKENTWRSLDNLKTTSPCVSQIRGCVSLRQMLSVSVNGGVYWIVMTVVSSKWSFEVLKFNLAEERFSLLPFPKGIHVIYMETGYTNG